MDFDGVLFDLDGCIYAGSAAIPGAAEALKGLSEADLPFVFLTNNASRSAADVAQHISALGITVDPEQVITSGIVAARELARTLPAGAPVLVVGAPALVEQVESAGLRAVDSASDQPAAVVQGFSATTAWTHLAEACRAVRQGAQWWATNMDITLPTELGQMPANGAFVRIVAETTGAQPHVAGKPSTVMMEAGVRALGAQRPVMVGDRLETDIAGARAAGITSALVLTGVHSEADALAAVSSHRPDFLLDDLTALLPTGQPRAFV